MEKSWNNKAWFMVLPVLVLVAFSAVIPLMTVVNYSVQDTFGNNQFFWAGTQWFEEILASDRFWDALGRNLLFSGIILAIEIPLGIFIALKMPKSGIGVPVCLVTMALPLLVPWNVVGTIWQVFGRSDIGLLGYYANQLGLDYNYVNDPVDAWITVVIMDVWHWTSLVVLLCYASLVSIPDAYYQAARIDGASRFAVFRFIQLPKMKRVLLIAFLLRFMDSFMIYTEPFVLTGGGPGNATTFLSQTLTKMAVGQFDLNRSIQSTLTVARSEYSNVADVEIQLADIPLVTCNGGQINEVLLGLVINAAEAIGDRLKKTGERGKITVRSKAEGEYVILEVEDTGGGIPEEIRERVYDQFFTTKEVGRGTGQGLSVARKVIINGHNGSLDFTTEMGKGTTFIVKLPVNGFAME